MLRDILGKEGQWWINTKRKIQRPKRIKEETKSCDKPI